MALITAEQARELIPGLTGTNEDTLLNTLISRADAALAGWMGYPSASVGADPTLEQATYTHYVGEGLEGVRVRGAELRLPVWPVVSVTSVAEDTSTEWASPTTVESSDYTVTAKGVRAWSHSWSEQDHATRVVYVAGYATTPDWLAHATALLVRHMVRKRTEGGRQSSEGTSFRPDTIPDDVRQLVASHALPGAYVA